MEYSLAAALLVNVVVAQLANGVSENLLYASGTPYSYALSYSYTQPSLLLNHHLLPAIVNFDTDTASTTTVVGAETPLKDIPAIVEDGSEKVMKSDEIPSNQSTVEPPTALGEASLGESHLLAAESPFLEQAPSKALGELASSSLSSETDIGELKYYLSLPITYTTAKPMVWPKAYQFHVQDELGHYNYGYANEHSSKQEFKLLDGITRGAYNYIDAEGKLQIVSYVSSDEEGFRVAATNLPQPVVPLQIPNSPEVAAAIATHLQAQSEPVKNVNIANNAAAAAATGDGANTSGDNVVSGCNETSGVRR